MTVEEHRTLMKDLVEAGLAPIGIFDVVRNKMLQKNKAIIWTIKMFQKEN